MKKLLSIFAVCFTCTFLLVPLKQSYATEIYRDHIMAQYLCCCGQYKDQCEPLMSAVCDASEQEFCSDVCGG